MKKKGDAGGGGGVGEHEREGNKVKGDEEKRERGVLPESPVTVVAAGDRGG
jgi:hypothetical protein